MSLENTDVVDAIGIDKVAGVAFLALVDSWDWEDEISHLTALRRKLGAYLDFIEMGEIWNVYPDVKGRQIGIDVIGRFPLPPSAMAFLEEAAKVASSSGIIIRARTV
jgi:hypothetical protein